MKLEVTLQPSQTCAHTLIPYMNKHASLSNPYPKLGLPITVTDLCSKTQMNISIKTDILKSKKDSKLLAFLYSTYIDAVSERLHSVFKERAARVLHRKSSLDVCYPKRKFPNFMTCVFILQYFTIFFKN